MPRSALLASFLAVAALLAVVAPTQDPPPRALDFQERTLDNGLRVVTIADFTCPVVAVQVWYRVGSKDESPERQGFAHMFEHMMFRGTERLGPKDHFDLIRKTGGDCNAYTAFDNTTYVNRVPSNQLALVLWLEAERMAHLRIDEGGFATERKVVEEERRLGLNRPYGTVPEKVLPAIFTAHPYRWTPIGQIPHLRAAGVQELQDFWDRYYVPNNATLVIAGAVEHDAAQALAARHFGWVPKAPEPPRVGAREPAQTAPRALEIQEPRGPVPGVGLAFRTVPKGHADEVPLGVLFSILGGGESSRVYQDLVRERGLAVVAMGMAMTLEHDGLGILGGAAPPFGDTDKIAAALLEHVDAVREKGVTAAEVEKARNQMLRAFVQSLLAVESKASAAGEAATFEGGVAAIDRRLEAIRKVAPADVQRVAKEYLVPERRTQVTVKPTVIGMLSGLLGGIAKKGEGKDKGEGGDGDGDDEDEGAAEAEVAVGARAVPGELKATAVRPAELGDAPPVAPMLRDMPVANTVEETLANGLRVVVLEDREVPFVTAQLGVLNGAFTDDAGAIGAAAMACAVATKATAKHDAKALAEELERHAIEIGAGAGMDSASVTASAVSEQFARMMTLLAEVVTEPAFPAAELETARKQTLMALAVEEQSAEARADRELARVLWGEHPYARRASGGVKDVRELKTEHLAAWWKAYVRPEDSILYIAGDVEAKAAIASAKRALGAWIVTEGKKDVALPAVPEAEATRIFLVPRRGSVQSQIRVGHVAPGWGHPRQFAGVLLAEVFGGSFSSRLNDAVRVKKGLTYGARGGLPKRRFAGEFVASTFSKTLSTAAALRAVLDEVARLETEEPSQDELDAARLDLVGRFAGERETPSSRIGDLWTIAVNGLPDDHFQRYLAAIGAATTADLAAAARELVHPGRLAIVVVGDAEKIQDELSAIAPVTVVK